MPAGVRISQQFANDSSNSALGFTDLDEALYLVTWIQTICHRREQMRISTARVQLEIVCDVRCAGNAYFLGRRVKRLISRNGGV